MSCKTDDLVERLTGCLEESEDLRTELDIWNAAWVNSLEALSEIVDAFEVDERSKLRGKTILDVGTDCVKPLYIALKFEPDKIIGISEDLSIYSFASDLEQKSKLLTNTKINFYNCSFFDNENLKKTLGKEKFDFVLISKTLHHLRTGECVAKKRDQKHEHREDETEKCCIYKFEEQKIFERLLQRGKRVIVYEYFCPHDEDEDKVRGRGGYFTTREWKQIFRYLLGNHRVEFIKPVRCHLDEKELKKITAKLRKVDRICFYVETK